MMKTYTEQWREGTLPQGLYYTRSSNGRKVFSIHTGSKSNMFSPYDKMAHQVEEVLGPVPDYMDCKGLIYDSIYMAEARKRIDELETKCTQLEKRLEVSEKEHYRTLEQLRIATGALRETKEKLLHVELSGLDGDNRQKMYDLMFEDGVIDKALKEMEGVK